MKTKYPFLKIRLSVFPIFFFTNSIRDPNDPRKEEDAYTGRVRCEE